MDKWQTLKGRLSLQNLWSNWMLYSESAMEGGSPRAMELQCKYSGQYSDMMEAMPTPSVRSLKSFTLGNFGTSCV